MRTYWQRPASYAHSVVVNITARSTPEYTCKTLTLQKKGVQAVITRSPHAKEADGTISEKVLRRLAPRQGKSAFGLSFKV